MTSRKIANQLTDILIKTVEEGTGEKADISEITIAGKTGTAQKPISKKEGFSHEKFIASFAGYSVDEPRVLCLVILN